MKKPPIRCRSISGLATRLPGGAGIFSPLLPLFLSLAAVPWFDADAHARPPRAERVVDRMAERRYARMSIAEARATRAEARVAEIAPVVPVPPPPRPATLRRMARAGVPLGGPMPPGMIAARPPVIQPPVVAGQVPAGPPTVASRPAPRPAASAASARQPAPPPATEPGAWTLGPDEGVAPASAEVASDGTRSVLSAGGGPPPAPTATPKPAAAAAGRSGPAVTQPPIELLPTPEAK